MNYLRNIQHIRFDKVEVIDKPQGQYQGYDVLINLHTKKNYEGYEGMLFNNEGFNLNGENDKKYIFENTTANFSYTKTSGIFMLLPMVLLDKVRMTRTGQRITCRMESRKR